MSSIALFESSSHHHEVNQHDPKDLIALFDACFAKSHRTRLAYGGDEPLYIPARTAQAYHTVFFAHGFFSSALHECAHWLLAGKTRRTLVDYGYWYMPEGRTPAQQALFQQVEIKPQALEWLLATAAGYPFQLSFDNLDATPEERAAFQAAVQKQRDRYQRAGLPPRAALFYQAVLAHRFT